MRSFFQQCEVFSFLILNGSKIALPENMQGEEVGGGMK